MKPFTIWIDPVRLHRRTLSLWPLTVVVSVTEINSFTSGYIGIQDDNKFYSSGIRTMSVFTRDLDKTKPYLIT